MNYEYGDSNLVASYSDEQSNATPTGTFGIVEKSDNQYCLLLTGEYEFINNYFQTYAEICSNSTVRLVDCNNIDVDRAMSDQDYVEESFKYYFLE